MNREESATVEVRGIPDFVSQEEFSRLFLTAASAAKQMYNGWRGWSPKGLLVDVYQDYPPAGGGGGNLPPAATGGGGYSRGRGAKREVEPPMGGPSDFKQPRYGPGDDGGYSSGGYGGVQQQVAPTSAPPPPRGAVGGPGQGMSSDPRMGPPQYPIQSQSGPIAPPRSDYPGLSAVGGGYSRDGRLGPGPGPGGYDSMGGAAGGMNAGPGPGLGPGAIGMGDGQPGQAMMQPLYQQQQQQQPLQNNSRMPPHQLQQQQQQQYQPPGSEYSSVSGIGMPGSGGGGGGGGELQRPRDGPFHNPQPASIGNALPQQGPGGGSLPPHHIQQVYEPAPSAHYGGGMGPGTGREKDNMPPGYGGPAVQGGGSGSGGAGGGGGLRSTPPGILPQSQHHQQGGGGYANNSTSASGYSHSGGGAPDPYIPQHRSNSSPGGSEGMPLLPSAAAAGAAASSPLRDPDASSTLFVECLPVDALKREVSHIFRPFEGFQSVRLIHKDRGVDGIIVLGFVEFASAANARVALNTLQGYPMDLEKEGSPVLRLSYARSKPHPPGIRNQQEAG
eukprot:CAMPEP_0117654366 /NCGR_PEP_ID=MMETSP0804-20121206/3705_1 /TAXON_ID=1074897 /ORGANISM="Tetraselmis astigmatica, Strain CCMP880" /LENGTH=556 /DNA_ID=CAMNT_0005460641 /DNA_START=187 /DNA_END=1853 /DNA_ORIENTATION=-